MRQHMPTRVKLVSNRERQRLAQTAIIEMERVKAILLAVLSKCGGEVTVPQTILDQIGFKLDRLDYEIVVGEDQSSFIVKLTESENEKVKMSGDYTKQRTEMVSPGADL